MWTAPTQKAAAPARGTWAEQRSPKPGLPSTRKVPWPKDMRQCEDGKQNMGKEVIPPDMESAKPHVVPGVTVESVIHLRLSPEQKVTAGRGGLG